MCFCFSSLSLSSSAVNIDVFDTFDLPDVELPDTPLQDMVDVMDPYAMMPLIDQQYNWLGDASKQDGFEFTEVVLNSKNFLYYEYLPYGSDTLVLGFRNKSNTALYLVFLDAYASNIILQTWNNNNGRCAFEIMSLSPIYRMGFALQTGEYISFYGRYGLTDKDVSFSENSLGVASYYFAYTLTANDYYFVVTDNIYSNTGIGFRFINETTVSDGYRGIDFDTDVYPTVTQREHELQNQQNELIQEGNETSKSIWETLKSIPDMIGEKLKGLFIPEEGFFDTYVAEFQSYFRDRFGLLYELPDAVIGILQQFIAYSPAESGYKITFPEVVMPVLDNGEWYDRTIIEETDITFEFLEQGAFKTLYSMYRSVVWMIFIFALINLIIRKSERVFGGSG